MSTKLSVGVTATAPVDGAQPAEIPESYGYARLNYISARTVDAEDGANVVEIVRTQATLHQALSKTGTASLSVEDFDAGSSVGVQIETAQGIVMHSSQEIKPAGTAEAGFRADVAYPHNILVQLAARVSAPESLALSRAGRIVRLGAPDASFTGARLFVALIEDQDRVKALLGDPPAALKPIASDQGAVEAQLAALHFAPAELKADGSFEFSRPLTAATLKTGWLWLLTAEDESFAGHVAESQATFAKQRGAVILVLPAPKQAAKPQERGAAGAPTDGSGAGTKPWGSASPMDFSEQQVLAQPEQFSDDPGPFCRPFRNPQRILGERAFQTVLRIEQPDIGGKPSVKGDSVLTLDWLPTTKWRATTLAATGILNEASGSTGTSPSLLGRVVDAVTGRGVATALTSSARTALVARTSAYQKYLLGKPNVRTQISAETPVQWEGDASAYQATSLAKGHILEWRVQWRSNGYSLGDVAYTLPLAPRQVKRISKVTWDRRETATRRETFGVRDVLVQETARERSYADAVQANLSEWSRGGSRASTTAAAGGIGLALGPVVIGGGAAHGSASSSSWQQGGREMAASEQQSLRDAIRQYGESLRQLESTIVTEVSQQEAVEGVSEILRNPNYCHSLTIIYYQILRHLRVDTALVGVRECLFVPFAIRPFDLPRLIRWRDLITRGLRKQEFRWVMQYLEDVRNNFAGSSIPPGPRADHPITFLSGSIYIQLGIERPRSHADPSLDLDETLWHPLSALLGTPFRQVVRQMHAREEAGRDRYFQEEVAPTVATRWANRLRLRAMGGTASIPMNGADFTLASQYGFNQTVRIDFTYVPPQGERLTRRDLRSLRLTAVALPSGSIANVQRVNFHYRTERFDRMASFTGGSDDLINIDTGAPETLGANAYFPLSDWEQLDLRAEIRDAADDLLLHLNEHIEYYHKVIWWNLDRDKLYMLLDAFRLSPQDGRSLASVVEREPLGILGNSLVFRVASGAFIGVDGHKSYADLLNHYKDRAAQPEPIRISLPTDGLYAQAIMDECEACEEHYGSVDWVLSDNEPELEALGVEALRGRRAEPSGLTPTAPPPSLINLPNVPTAPDPSGFTALLNAITKSDAFRDMAGLAGTQAAAQAAMQTAAQLAGQFGGMAVDVRKAELATRQAPQKLAAIDKAATRGLIDDADKKDLAKQALAEMNTERPAADLNQDQKVREVLEKASNVPGNPIEVRRTNKDGEQLVKVGGGPVQASRSLNVSEYDKAEIKLRVFIPAPAVAMEIPLVGVVKAFSGDSRDFGFANGTSRAELRFTGTVDPSRSRGPVIGQVTRAWGETKEYKGDDVEDVPNKPSWWKSIKARANPEKVGQLQASDENLKVDAYRDSIEQVRFKITVEGTIPLLTGSPSISAEMFVTLYQPAGGPCLYRVSGNHDGFPAYELYVNGELAYKHDPVAKNQTPVSLFSAGAGEFDVADEFKDFKPLPARP